MNKSIRVFEIEEHNREQRAYFEGVEKKTMVPQDTPYLRRQTEELIRFTGLSKGDRVMEIGCGMGRYTFLLAERGIKVEGLDLSPVLLDQLRKYDAGRFNIPLRSIDILDYPKEWVGQFDAVVGFFTLHHIHDLEKVYAAMAAVLKPGGRIVFLEPNAYNPLYYIQILITPRMSFRGERNLMQMRRNVIFSVMQKAGLVNLSVARFGFFPPFLTNRPWGRKLESVLERFPLWKPCLPFQMFKGERSC